MRDEDRGAILRLGNSNSLSPAGHPLKTRRASTQVGELPMGTCDGVSGNAVFHPRFIGLEREQ